MDKFKCAICGKEFEDVEERIHCETTCLHQRKEAEAKKKELELQAERNKRMCEVHLAYENYLELKNEFVKDYGFYIYHNIHNTYDEDTKNAFDDFWKGLFE